MSCEWVDELWVSGLVAAKGAPLNDKILQIQLLRQRPPGIVDTMVAGRQQNYRDVENDDNCHLTLSLIQCYLHLFAAKRFCCITIGVNYGGEKARGIYLTV